MVRNDSARDIRKSGSDLLCRNSTPEKSAIRVLAQAIGAVAVGAAAIGALALGAVAIGALAIRRARIHKLTIDELVVGRLRVTEKLQAPPADHIRKSGRGSGDADGETSVKG